MSWTYSNLASLVSVLESGSRPKGGVSTESGAIPSLGGENIISTGGVTLNGLKRVPRKFYERMTKGHLLDADILINKDGAQTGKVGLYRNHDRVPSCINEHLFLIRGNAKKITQEYLYYTLLSQPSQSQIDAQISGSAQPGLKRDFLRGVFAYIPDALSEQTKISEILSTVDRAIEQTEALIAKQQRIKTGLMQDLLTRGIDAHGNLRYEKTHQFKDSPLGRIPVDWEVKELNDLVDEPITYGIVQAGPHIENGIPYIRTGDMAGDTIQVSELLRTSPQIAKSYKRSSIYPGDIVFALRATVGKVLPVNEELSGANLTQGTAKISPRDSVDSIFLLWAMRTSQVQNAIRLEQKGTTFMEITLGDLRRIKLALPKEKYEQSVIGERLNLHERLRRDFLEQKRKLQSIKTALMQDLLTGKRRVTSYVPTSSNQPGQGFEYLAARKDKRQRNFR